MKTLTKNLALVAVAATMLSACSQKETSPIQTEGEYSYTFQLGTGDVQDTKTTFASSPYYHVAWEDSDKIGVYTGTSINQPATVTTGTPCSMTVKSKNTIASGDKVYCYYPYNSTKYDAASSVNMDVPTLQQPTPTSAQVDAMPMVSAPYTMTSDVAAATEGTAGEIDMYNLGSLLVFKVYSSNATYVTEKVTAVTLEANSTIAGTFNFDLTKVDGTEANFAITDIQDARKSVTATADSLAVGATVDAAALVNMVVLPGKFTGKITIVTTAATYTYNVTSEKNAIRSSKLVLKADLANATTRTVHTIELKQAVVNESQIGVNWSVTGFTDILTDQADEYKIGIYNGTDSNCPDANLIYQWTFGKNGKGKSYNTENIVDNCFKWSYFYLEPGVIFSGLASSTKYYVKVTDITRSMAATAAYTTTESQVVDPTTLTDASANAGQIVLFEDFSQFTLGGDSVHYLSGYSSGYRGKMDTSIIPSGSDPFANVADSLFNVAPNTTIGIYNTMKGLLNTIRLKNWHVYVSVGTANNKYGNTGALAAEAGCLKVGANSATGLVVVPPLKCLKGTATLELQFDAARYVEGDALNGADPLTLEAGYFPATVTYGGTGNYWIAIKTTSNAPTIGATLTMDSQPGWQHCKMTLSNVPAGRMIGVGPVKTDTRNGQHRIYLDNLQVKVVSYN